MTLTPQDLFTKAYTGVVNQGELSRGHTGSCFYQHTLGLCCAIGQLIDDEGLRRQMDNQGGSVKSIALNGPLAKEMPDWFIPNIDLLDQMQKAHDGWGTAEPGLDNFKTHMASIAKEHGFHVPDLTPATQPS